MEELITPAIGTTIVAAVIGGVRYLVKYILNKRDEAQKKVFEERDKERAEIKERINKVEKKADKTEKQLHNVIGMIIKCDDPDCPTKKVLANYWNKENAEDDK